MSPEGHRLPPDKREELRFELEELIQQEIIASVSESEDIAINSPVVLV